MKLFDSELKVMDVLWRLGDRTVINDKFSFIERDDSNISRCTVCEWWQNFVDELDKVRLGSREVIQHGVERIRNWIESQVGPSLYILMSILDKKDALP